MLLSTNWAVIFAFASCDSGAAWHLVRRWEPDRSATHLGFPFTIVLLLIRVSVLRAEIIDSMVHSIAASRSGLVAKLHLITTSLLLEILGDEVGPVFLVRLLVVRLS